MTSTNLYLHLCVFAGYNLLRRARVDETRFPIVYHIHIEQTFHVHTCNKSKNKLSSFKQRHRDFKCSMGAIDKLTC